VRRAWGEREGESQATATVERWPSLPSLLSPLPRSPGAPVSAVTHTNLALRYLRYHQGRFAGNLGGGPDFAGERRPTRGGRRNLRLRPT